MNAGTTTTHEPTAGTTTTTTHEPTAGTTTTTHEPPAGPTTGTVPPDTSLMPIILVTASLIMTLAKQRPAVWAKISELFGDHKWILTVILVVAGTLTTIPLRELPSTAIGWYTFALNILIESAITSGMTLGVFNMARIHPKQEDVL
jgi:hypothetical protein